MDAVDCRMPTNDPAGPTDLIVCTDPAGRVLDVSAVPLLCQNMLCAFRLGDQGSGDPGFPGA